jgi:tetratricopeptide (TPR) repeat protein
MKQFLLLAGPALVLMAACSSAPEAPAVDYSLPVIEAEAGDREGSNYHLLMAEIALQREEYAVAADEYYRASRNSGDPELLGRSAGVIFDYGSQDQALEIVRRWAAVEPENPDPRRMLVQSYLRQGDPDGAAYHLNPLYDLAASDHPEGFVTLLPLFLDARDPEVAVRAMRQVADGRSGNESAQYAVAYLALRADDPDMAVDYAGRASELAPEWQDAAVLYARSLVAADRADEALDYLAGRLDANSPRLRMERAVILMAAGRIDEAREELLALKDAEATRPGVLRSLGYLEYHAGNLEQAEEHFVELMSTGRYMDEALFYLASIAEQQGDVDTAMRFYGRVTTGDNAVTAQVRLALLLYNLGETEAALRHLQDFSRMAPWAESELVQARGELMNRMGDFDGALNLYDEYLERHPEDDDLRYARAFLYERLDRVDEAVAELEALVSRRPEDPVALNALGYTLADRTERHGEAYDYIEKALERAPDNAAIIDSMGWVLHKLGRNEEALGYLERAWEMIRDPEVAAHIGDVLWALGRREEARTFIAEAMTLFPDDEKLIAAAARLLE